MQNSITGCCYLTRTEAKMITMQYTNCVVNCDKVQTVKLTLYRHKSWRHVLCKK